MTIGLVTCRDLPDLITGDQLLLAELRKQNHQAVPVIWDSDADWKAFDLLIIRNTWDYFLRIGEFLPWIDHIERLGVRLLNPPAVIRWNSDKRYLLELESRGVLLPETVWIEDGHSPDLRTILHERGWTEAVIKPVVSGGAISTFRFTPDTVDGVQKQIPAPVGCWIIQEFLPEILDPGEYSFIFFRGDYSHTILKTPKPGDFRVQKRHGGGYQLAHPPQDYIEQAAFILSRIPFDEVPLYARVDTVIRNHRLLLCELEILEPELYFEYDLPSITRMIDAITR